MKKYNVCIVGVTGAVGSALLESLEGCSFAINQLFPLASESSAGRSIQFKGESIKILATDSFDFSQADIGLFSAGSAVSEHYAPLAAQKGCVVIDNTAHFRLKEGIPLVVPEVNPEKVAQYQNQKIISNPNCSTIQMLVALKPIYDRVGISRINVATYQAVSGSGKEGLQELREQQEAILKGQPVKCSVYPKQIAQNCLPHIDMFLPNGYTKEEMKMLEESRKILDDQDILVNPTAVRVPVEYAHSEALHIETKQKITAEEAKQLLSESPGVCVMDDPAKGLYPTSLDAQKNPQVFVGRIREDISHPLGLNLWVVSDSTRKGAATNAVQIAEILASQYL